MDFLPIFNAFLSCLVCLLGYCERGNSNNISLEIVVNCYVEAGWLFSKGQGTMVKAIFGVYWSSIYWT